jgi:hypothetical protein
MRFGSSRVIGDVDPSAVWLFSLRGEGPDDLARGEFNRMSASSCLVSSSNFRSAADCPSGLLITSYRSPGTRPSDTLVCVPLDLLKASLVAPVSNRVFVEGLF